MLFLHTAVPSLNPSGNAVLLPKVIHAPKHCVIWSVSSALCESPFSGAPDTVFSRAHCLPRWARCLPQWAHCPLCPACPLHCFPLDFSHFSILRDNMYSSQVIIYIYVVAVASRVPPLLPGRISEILGGAPGARLFSRTSRAPSRSLCGRWLCCTFDGLMHVL